MMLSRTQIEEIAGTLGGVPVLGCLPGSPSDKAGVRYGDVVLAINGVKVSTAVEYLDAKGLRKDGSMLHLFRDGVEFDVFVPIGPPLSLDALYELMTRHCGATESVPKVLS